MSGKDGYEEGRRRMSCAVILEVNACRNACVFCGEPRQRFPRGELACVRELFLKHAWELRREGRKVIEISGADPLEYAGLPSLVRVLKQRFGYRYVMLSTHGRPLKDQRLVRQFQDAGVDEYKIPLYGSGTGVHDAVTRKKGSFQETLAGLHNIIECAPGTKIFLTSMMVRQNFQDMPDILEMASALASRVMINIPCIADVARAGTFALSFKEIGECARALLARGSAKGVPWRIANVPFCLAGTMDERIINRTPPPVTAESYEIPEQFKGAVAKIPSYRLKRKIAMCQSCCAMDSCDGFYATYLQCFRTRGLRPLKVCGKKEGGG